MQPKIEDWDRELNNYRRSSKRVSTLVTHNPHSSSSRVPPPIPSRLLSMRGDEGGVNSPVSIDIVAAAAAAAARGDNDDDDSPVVTAASPRTGPERKEYASHTPAAPTVVEDNDDGASDEDDDEEDDEPTEDAWHLFVSPEDQTKRVYYNFATKQAAYKDPPPGATMGKTLKRGSSILSEAWGNAHTTTTRRESPRGGVGGADGAGADAGTGRIKNNRERLVDVIQLSLTDVARHIEVLAAAESSANSANNASGAGAAGAGAAGAGGQPAATKLTEAISVARTNLAAAIKAMKTLQSSIAQEQAPIDYLLAPKTLRWDFASTATSAGLGNDNSPSVSANGGAGSAATGAARRDASKSFSGTASVSAIDYYRATSQLTNHEELAYSEYHMPRYYSQQALPPPANEHLSIKASCVVRMDGPVKQTKLEVDASETAAHVIQRAYAKQPRGSPDVLDMDQYVLKVAGHHEYMDGDDPFFSYAHVRHCLRDHQDIELLLVRRPDPGPASESTAVAQAAALVTSYRNKIDRSIRLVTAETHVAAYKLAMNPKADLWQLRSLPMAALHTPFSLKVVGIDNINTETFPRLTPNIGSIYIRACLFHGCEYLDWSHELPAQELGETVRWDAMLQGGYSSQYSLLPREVRLGFVVIAKRADKDKEVPLAWVTSVLVDHMGVMRTGRVEFKLWPFPATEGKKHGKKRDLDPDFLFRATTLDNKSVGAPVASLVVDMPRFALPVVAPLAAPYSVPNSRVVGHQVPDSRGRLGLEQSRALVHAIGADPLFRLTSETKQLLWSYRHYLVDDFSALAKVLQCVDWGQQDFRNEAHRLLKLWTQPSEPARALEFLDAKYADYTVRKWAVEQLYRLTDDELQLYLLQLTQCLKFEPYHDSPLSRFMLERALKAPYQVGHSFFWHLKAEVHDPLICERFALIIEEFLSHAGYYVEELYKQAATVHKLQRIAEMIVHLKRDLQYSDADAMREYTKEIERVNKTFFQPMGRFQIPLNPKWEATGLIVEKCRFMSSKMVPLWLVFRNADEDGPPIYVIFKSGDDLRQDLLTLQLLRVMDQMWLSNKLDMRLKPYRVLATGVNDNGDGVGMIEIVLNSDTTSGIQHKYGGGAMGALKLDPIDNFIREHNKDSTSFYNAVDNFIRSCAGYCVATYVLGIGDRHNGNIMVTKSGHLFHIDFGHFLGNFKKKFGVNRERAAFVFTPEMAYVIGGKNYRKSNVFLQFLRTCSYAFKVLRANAGILETLFILMVAAGMPELMRESDILYLRNKLNVELPNSVAEKELEAEIDKSLNSTYRRIDNYIHILRHNG